MPRREFLYDICFWEARRIVKGYRQRNSLQLQIQRIQAWASMFCMGNPDHKLPQDLFPLPSDEKDVEALPRLTDEERRHLEEEAAAFSFAPSGETN